MFSQGLKIRTICEKVSHLYFSKNSVRNNLRWRNRKSILFCRWSPDILWGVMTLDVIESLWQRATAGSCLKFETESPPVFGAGGGVQHVGREGDEPLEPDPGEPLDVRTGPNPRNYICRATRTRTEPDRTRSRWDPQASVGGLIQLI